MSKLESQPLILKLKESTMNPHINPISCLKPKRFRHSHMHPEPLKPHRFIHKNYFKNQEIHRENLSLLDKLLHLSNQKRKLRTQSPKRTNLSLKSMNHSTRKAKSEKIQEENLEMASRLANVTASVNTKSLVKFFSSHIKYKTNICKIAKRNKCIDSMLTLNSKRGNLSPITRRSYTNGISNSKKEWKVASISPLPGSGYLIAVPIAINI